MDANIISNLIFIIGLIFLIIGLFKNQDMNNKPKEVIKYIPRSFEEEQKEPASIVTIFKSMFENQSPWVGSFHDNTVIPRRKLSKERGILASKNNTSALLNSDEPADPQSNKPLTVLEAEAAAKQIKAKQEEIRKAAKPPPRIRKYLKDGTLL